jgi:hypothetical protein
MRRQLRRHRTKAIVAAVVVVLIAFIGLFIRSYHDSGPVGKAPNAIGSTTSVPELSPSASDSSSASSKPSGSPTGSILNYTFPNGMHYTGGDTSFFRFAPQHIVVLNVYSHGNVPLIRVGWLAPESYDAPYGDIRHVGSPWSLTLHSSGDKYHAALFIGTDASANPVTCEIWVDGQLKQRLTAEHVYARQVCVG